MLWQDTPLGLGVQAKDSKVRIGTLKTLLLLFFLGIMMSAHLALLVEKQNICRKAADAVREKVIKGEKIPVFPEKYSKACVAINGDIDRTADKYLAVIVSLMAGGAALGSRSD